MKRTAIRYKKINGKVYVKKIENAAEIRELQHEFGEEVMLEYLNGAPMYRKSTDNKHDDPDAIMVASEDGKVCIIGKDDVIGSKEFGEIIETMKAAGDRLGKLCGQAEEKKVVI